MNVLRVIGSMNPSTGGPCQGIRNAIPELEKLGLHNEVVSLDDPAALFLGQDSFKIHPLGPVRGPWCYTDKLIPWLLEHFQNFDVVVIHGLWLYHSYAVMKALRTYKEQVQAAKKKGKVPKCFIMPHGMLDPYFQRAPERKLKAMRNWLYWKIIEMKVINEADGLLFTCEAELQLARESFYPYQPKQEIDVGYGIAEPPAYTPAMREAFLAKCPGLNESPYILFLSRIHEKKGVALLVEAYARIASIVSEINSKASLENPPSAVRAGQEAVKNSLPKLIIAGPGLDTDYGHKIKNVVKKNTAINGSVFFPGMLTGEAKWGAFYGCEAFVLPSHQENFGIAVAEALACGKPVLISNQVNICNKVMSYGGGMVVEDTLEGTQHALEGFFKLAHENRKAIGSQARSLYERSFAIAPVANQFMHALLKY